MALDFDRPTRPMAMDREPMAISMVFPALGRYG
jgi:hypothetical protein